MTRFLVYVAIVGVWALALIAWDAHKMRRLREKASRVSQRQAQRESASSMFVALDGRSRDRFYAKRGRP